MFCVVLFVPFQVKVSNTRSFWWGSLYLLHKFGTELHKAVFFLLIICSVTKRELLAEGTGWVILKETYKKHSVDGHMN